MKNQITVTLAQIKEYESPLRPRFGRKFSKRSEGIGADLNKRFPVSSILDSNGLDDTLMGTAVACQSITFYVVNSLGGVRSKLRITLEMTV